MQKKLCENLIIYHESTFDMAPLTCFILCGCKKKKKNQPQTSELQGKTSECVWMCALLSVAILITTMSNNSCNPPPAAHIGRVCKQDVDPSNSQLF